MGLSGQIAAGAVAGGITGGGRGALAGAVSAGMFSQLHGMDPGIGKIAAHGVVGGMMSEMQGGSFKSGFLAAGFTQALSPAIGRIDSGTVGPSVQRTIAAAIVGGTASVIGGGKFANGAMTGAFSRLFNDDAKQAWMDKNGQIHPGEHPDHKSGTCGRNAMCAVGLSEPQRGKDGQILLGTALQTLSVASTVASGGTAALIWAGRGTAAVMAIDRVAGLAGSGLFINEVYNATQGADVPVSGTVSATTGFFGDQALKLDGHHIGGPIKLIGPVIDLGAAAWSGLSQ